ncbi:MAG: DUF1059 domain-containing protein [Nitrososphaeraceae archaeon]
MALCLAGKLLGNTLICLYCCVVVKGDIEDEIMSKAGEHGGKEHNIEDITLNQNGGTYSY